MSYRLLSLTGRHALAIVVISGLWVYPAVGGGKERGKSIEFSAPRSEEVTTNLHQFTSKKDSLKALEEDLYKSLRTFSPKSSLEGVAAEPAPTPSGPVIPNKRVKELLERRKNWAFVNPKDLMNGPSMDEIFKLPEYGPDGQEKQSQSLVGQYYQQLGAKRGNEPGSGQRKDEGGYGFSPKGNARDNAGAHEELNLPPGIRDSEQALKKVLESDSSTGPATPTTTRSSFSDIFGLSNPSTSRDKDLEHKKQMDEFRRILDPVGQAAANANPAKSPGGITEAARATAQPGSGLGAWTLGKREGFDTQLGTINPVLTPSGPPDVNAQALGQSSLTPVVPKTEPVKTSPSAPTFAAPRRAF
jgi:hypothetical protein